MRDTYIRVKMTKDEKTEIEEAAYYIGETLSSYVRRIMLASARRNHKAA
jgi:uncharacterized protein (DUF1778 family)